MERDIASMERELRAAGHQIQRTYEAPVGSRQEFSDAEWVFRVDGKVVARGAAIGQLAAALQRWMEVRRDEGSAGGI